MFIIFVNCRLLFHFGNVINDNHMTNIGEDIQSPKELVEYIQLINNN